MIKRWEKSDGMGTRKRERMDGGKEKGRERERENKIEREIERERGGT